MKFYTSYFYAVRFMTPNMIPLSTAIWDPKWFHDFKGKYHIFRDENGVYNGIRFEQLNPLYCHAKGCPCNDKESYESCMFLRDYRKGLSEVDFEYLMRDINEMVDFLVESDGLIKDDICIVLLVYEAPDNPCSERIPLQELFKSHGVDISEWKFG